MLETLINPQIIFDSTTRPYIMPVLMITIITAIGTIIHEKYHSKNNH
jgi:hypothetical protein